MIRILIGVIVALSVALAVGWTVYSGRVESLTASTGDLRHQVATLTDELAAAEQGGKEARNRADQLDQSVLGMMKDNRRLHKQAQDWKRRYEEIVNADDDCKAWAVAPLPRCISDGLLPGSPGYRADAGPPDPGAALHDRTDADP